MNIYEGLSLSKILKSRTDFNSGIILDLKIVANYSHLAEVGREYRLKETVHRSLQQRWGYKIAKAPRREVLIWRTSNVVLDCKVRSQMATLARGDSLCCNLSIMSNQASTLCTYYLRDQEELLVSCTNVLVDLLRHQESLNCSMDSHIVLCFTKGKAW